MIELKTLSKSEVLNLVRGCEPPNFNTQNLKWQQGIYKVLYQGFGYQYRTEIKMIVTGACRCVRYGLTGIIFPLDRKVFKEVNKKRPTNKISYKKITELISMMEKNEYLTVLKGYYRSQEDSFTTCLRFSSKMLNNLDKRNCDKWGVSRVKDLDVVEVVDSVKSQGHYKTFKTTQGMKGIRKLKEDVELVNNVLSEHDISYKGESCCVVYKRRFEDDLFSGGRWYAVGTFQVEVSEGRPSILIDKTPTVEVDVNHIHPAILASIAGTKLKPDYDPYDIASYVNTPISHETLRNFIKPCFMSLLYAKNRGTALYEIRNKLYNDRHVGNWLDAETILEALEDHNQVLSEFFYKKDNWKLCQFIDSQIASKIMVHFASKGEACLNYHDSWIVTYHNKEELVRVLTESWRKVVGNLDNFSYGVEFDNTPNTKYNREKDIE